MLLYNEFHFLHKTKTSHPQQSASVSSQRHIIQVWLWWIYECEVCLYDYVTHHLLQIPEPAWLCNCVAYFSSRFLGAEFRRHLMWRSSFFRFANQKWRLMVSLKNENSRLTKEFSPKGPTYLLVQPNLLAYNHSWYKGLQYEHTHNKISYLCHMIATNPSPWQLSDSICWERPRDVIE